MVIPLLHTHFLSLSLSLTHTHRKIALLHTDILSRSLSLFLSLSLSHTEVYSRKVGDSTLIPKYSRKYYRM